MFSLRPALLPLFKNQSYIVRCGLAKGLKRKSGLGFIPQIIPLTQEEKFLMNLDLGGKTIYDVGGYEGIFTIFFARAVGNTGRVITFEPNPENYGKLIENIRLNKFDNVVALSVGLGKREEKATLVFNPSAFGFGSIEKEIKAIILLQKGAKSVEVEVDSIDHLIMINNWPKPDFIKVDVEGLEMDVLLGARETIKEFRPKLLVEIHNGTVDWNIKNRQRVVGFLIASGYCIYCVELGEMITSINTKILVDKNPLVIHLYCY